jgi:hypothetical protein
MLCCKLWKLSLPKPPKHHERNDSKTPNPSSALFALSVYHVANVPKPHNPLRRHTKTANLERSPPLVLNNMTLHPVTFAIDHPSSMSKKNKKEHAARQLHNRQSIMQKTK